MRSSALPYCLSLILLAVAAYGGWHVWKLTEQRAAAGSTGGSVMASSERLQLADFELIDQNGKPFDTRKLDGQVWVASFFFAGCPSMCFRLNQTLQALQEELGDADVRFVSITVDPKNDTPEVLTAYAKRFNADPNRWIFLTGELDKIQRIGKDVFRLPVAEQTHSDRAVVIDRQGRFAAQFRVLEPDQLKLLKKTLAVVRAEEAPRAKTAQSAAAAPKS